MFQVPQREPTYSLSGACTDSTLEAYLCRYQFSNTEGRQFTFVASNVEFESLSRTGFPFNPFVYCLQFLSRKLYPIVIASEDKVLMGRAHHFSEDSEPISIRRKEYIVSLENHDSLVKPNLNGTPSILEVVATFLTKSKIGRDRSFGSTTDRIHFFILGSKREAQEVIDYLNCSAKEELNRQAPPPDIHRPKTYFFLLHLFLLREYEQIKFGDFDQTVANFASGGIIVSNFRITRIAAYAEHAIQEFVLIVKQYLGLGTQPNSDAEPGSIERIYQGCGQNNDPEGPRPVLPSSSDCESGGRPKKRARVVPEIIGFQ